MIPSINIIKYLLIYNNYNKYYKYIYINKDIKEEVFLFNCLKQLQDKYNKDISFTEYSMYCLSKVSETNKETIELLLKQINTAVINEDIINDILKSLKNKQLAHELTLHGLNVVEGKASIDHIFETLNKFEQQEEHSNVSFVSSNLEELYNESVKQKGLRWRLSALNRSLGSLRTGDFGFIFARPETGKTTFLASEITNFARQVTKPILWFNNEEQGSKVMLRCYQAALGITQTQLFGDLDGNSQKFLDVGGDKIRLFDSATIHKKHVEQLCREYEPSLIVFDQIDKIKGFSDDREDLRLGAIYQWARELAKTYSPVIAVCQADGTGEGKKWLTMENVANAKTAKQAEADWIVGIGKTHNDSEEYLRFLNICKNKLAGDQDSDPEQRHGKQIVAIQPSLALYEDVQ